MCNSRLPYYKQLFLFGAHKICSYTKYHLRKKNCSTKYKTKRKKKLKFNTAKKASSIMSLKLTIPQNSLVE